MTVFVERPAIAPHRGFGRRTGPGATPGLPENSLAAFRAALDAGARWLEVDVRRTADDDLFVLHYPTLADGRFLADVSTAEVAAAGVLALDDLMAEIPAGVGLIFDVKTALEDAVRSMPETTTGLLIEVIEAERSRRPQLVTSFDPAALMFVGEAIPGIPRGLISWISFPLRKAIPAAAHLGLEVVSAHWKSFGTNGTDSAPVFREAAHYLDVAHRAGLEVLAWSPALDAAQALVAAGLDALIVDDLPGALERFSAG